MAKPGLNPDSNFTVHALNQTEYLHEKANCQALIFHML